MCLTIDVERQLNAVRAVSAEVAAGRATLELLCIETRGLLFMTEVMERTTSLLTDSLSQQVKSALAEAARVAKERIGRLPEPSEKEKGSGLRVIDRVQELSRALVPAEQ